MVRDHRPTSLNPAETGLACTNLTGGVDLTPGGPVIKIGMPIPKPGTAFLVKPCLGVIVTD